MTVNRSGSRHVLDMLCPARDSGVHIVAHDGRCFACQRDTKREPTFKPDERLDLQILRARYQAGQL